MKTYTGSILTARTAVNVVETSADRVDFLEWCKRHDSQFVGMGGRWVAIDTETTGLDIYGSDRLRMVQFGDKRTAWVLPLEGPYVQNRGAISYALDMLPRQLAHNRPFDAAALSQAGFSHRLWEGRDTMIMAHLLDSRGKEDGGIGHGLKALAAHYIQPDLTDSDEALKAWAKTSKVKLEDRFREAPIRLPELEHYAGMDCLLTAGLNSIFEEMLTEAGLMALLQFESAVQLACHDMADRGLLLDVEYAEALQEHFLDEEDIIRQKLDAHGIENPNAPTQIKDALLRGGAKLTVKTPSGDLSVSRDALDGVDHPVAQLVQDFRHATKYRVSYVDRCLEMRDKADRIHPGIRSLQARTARMSVSNPPLQQLPTDDALIRRMFIADPGHVVCSADYSQVELRVLAALSKEQKMLDAIANGVDLHTNTASLVGIDRKLAKMTNFLIVYGGGAQKLSTGAHIDLGEAKKAINGFHRAFPSIKRYGNRLQERSGHGERPVVTPAGRKLKLDRDRTYAAVNYVVQSTARDVLAEAMLEVYENDELRPLMMLPVHDELVFQAPAEDAQRVADSVASTMSRDFMTVHLEAEGEVYGPSWGHGYKTDNLPEAVERFF